MIIKGAEWLDFMKKWLNQENIIWNSGKWGITLMYYHFHEYQFVFIIWLNGNFMFLGSSMWCKGFNFERIYMKNPMPGRIHIQILPAGGREKDLETEASN